MRTDSIVIENLHRFYKMTVCLPKVIFKISWSELQSNRCLLLTMLVNIISAVTMLVGHMANSHNFARTLRDSGYIYM